MDIVAHQRLTLPLPSLAPPPSLSCTFPSYFSSTFLAAFTHLPHCIVHPTSHPSPPPPSLNAPITRLHLHPFPLHPFPSPAPPSLPRCFHPSPPSPSRHGEYIPKMPNEEDLDLIFDTSFSDIQPYLYRITYQTSDDSASVGNSVRKFFKETLAL